MRWVSEGGEEHSWCLYPLWVDPDVCQHPFRSQPEGPWPALQPHVPPSAYLLQRCCGPTGLQGPREIQLLLSWASFGFLDGNMVKNLPSDAGDARECRFHPWVGKIPWRRKWQPTPVFLPGKFHGRRSLVGYSPQGHKESDMTVDGAPKKQTAPGRPPRHPPRAQTRLALTRMLGEACAWFSVLTAPHLCFSSGLGCEASVSGCPCIYCRV